VGRRPLALLQEADVVVTHAGQNAVAEVAAARRPAVLVPQAAPTVSSWRRPRHRRGAAGGGRGRLAGAGAVGGVLDEASALDPAAGAWSDGGGAARAAALLDEAAHACARR
jgi:hypothetical protein